MRPIFVLLPNREDFTMALIKSYYDGRGNSKAKKDPLVVLSGMVAECDVWRGFQSEWLAHVTPLCGGAPLSVTDCLSGKGDFDDIDETTRIKAVEAGIEILSKWTSNGITVYSCAVILDAHKRCLAEKIPIQTPEAICVDEIIPCIDYQFPNDHFELYFDRSEGFLRHVEMFWRRKRKANGPYYLRRVEQLAKSSDSYAAIQGADLYTWTVHTYCEQRFVLGSDLVTVPTSILAIIKDPPISSLWDYEMLKNNVRARHRTLASMTRVPDWAMNA